MKKEIYKMRRPERIIFGDPFYFEQHKGQRLRSLVVDYKPPRHFEARLVLLEQKSEQLEDFIERSMVIYLAPSETMKTYLDGMKYTSQKMKEKMIGVDTARYLLTVNDRSDEIRTGGDGCWGSEIELYRQVGNQRVSDAVMISMALPDHMNFDDMRRMARYFFPDMQQINKGEKKRDRGDSAR